MTNTENIKRLRRNSDLDAFMLIVSAVWVLFILGLTDDGDGSEESFLDEFTRTICMMFSVGTITLFLISELYTRVGITGVVGVALVLVVYLSRNFIIDKLCNIIYNLISRPFGIYD